MKKIPFALFIVLIALACPGCRARPAGLSDERMAAMKKAAVVSLLADELRVDDQAGRDATVTNRVVEGWAFREVTEDPVRRLVHARSGVDVVDSASVRLGLMAAMPAEASERPAYEREPLASAVKRLQTEGGIDTLLLIRADTHDLPSGIRPVSGPGLLRESPDKALTYGALAVDVLDTASGRLLATGRGYVAAPFEARHWDMCARGEGPDSIAGLRAQTRDLLEAAAAEAARPLGIAPH